MNVQTFDPARYLSSVNGRDYLEVKWRLVWVRTEYPECSIETQLVSHVDHEAVFKATVQLPTGAIATGYGMEDSQGFGDYLEKAETKAIGRALAALGYGTQFCGDFDFGAAVGKVVDSPVDAGPRPQAQESAGRSNSGSEATSRQRNLIQALAREQGLNGSDLEQLATEAVGDQLMNLTRKSASDLIQVLQDRQERSGATR